MGKVYLVGAGPGDPELLTVRAAQLLSRADVILHDALVSPEILALANPKTRLFDIGKRCGAKLLTQVEINALLIAHAQTSETVVRLKGGDPSVFGRSGEEISALNDAGVDFEIVPGITTATAVAAAAKISLTDRRHASAITLMTAHRGRDEDAVEWDRLVTSGATIAIYMPGKDYREISAQLRRSGLAADTPCVVVSQVSSPNEQKLYTSVSALSHAAALPAPSLLIVGRCASAFERFDPELASLGPARMTAIEKEIA